MSELQTILPANRTDAEEALDLAAAARLGAVPVPIADLWSPERCAVSHLRHLAWALSVDTWDDGWPEGTRRAVIAASIAVHRKKGTVAAVKEAIRVAGYNDATMVERFGWEVHDGAISYDGQATHAAPDHWAEFRVILTRPISVAQAEQVRAIIDAVKPARSHLKLLDFREAASLHNGRISHDGAYTHGVV